jgi:SOS-response transcriptional repressor LexA
MTPDWVSQALAYAGMTQAELARRLTAEVGQSVDRAAVNKMTTGARKVSGVELAAISRVTGYAVPDEWFQKDSDFHDEAIDATSVPVLSWVAASSFDSEAGFEAQDAEEFIALSGLKPGVYVGLRVRGDSMDRIAPPGSLIVFNRTDRVLVDRAFYVFRDEEYGATFKRYATKPPRLEPFSTNDTHLPIFPVGPPKVVGRVHRIIIEV